MPLPTTRQVDEHGQVTLDPSMPADVQYSDQAFERWKQCAQIAALVTGQPEEDPETGAFARVLYGGGLPSHRADVPGVMKLQESPDLLDFERLHPRDRVGEFRRKPRVPQMLRRRTPPPHAGVASPGVSQETIRKLGLDKEQEPSPLAYKVLGGFKTTAARWYAKRAYHPEDSEEHPPYKARRRRRHDRIVGTFLAGLEDPKKPRGLASMLGAEHPIVQKLVRGGRLTAAEKDEVRKLAHNARSGESPEALFMGGGPAAGKSTTLDENPELEPTHAVRVDADAVKTFLPEFQDLRAEKDHYAAEAVHLESGDIAARIAAEAEALGLNTVIDGTLDSEPEDPVRQLQRKHDAGYDVSVLYATTPTEVAIPRAIDRALETGRYVSVPTIRKQHAKVSRNFDHVVALPWLDHVDVFDDDGLIGTKEGGAFHELEPERMREFRAKQGEWDYEKDARAGRGR